MGLPKKHIDSLEFARIRSVLKGALDVADLPRIQDVLASNAGQLSFALEGARDADGKSWLHVTVDGGLQLECQRCLRAVALPLSLRRHLQLIPPGGTWPDDDLEDDSTDAIPSEKELSVLDLLEDEVLLALPVVAMHDRCESPSLVKVGDLQAEKTSPFAALAALKLKQ